jgi:hypothetical protein
VRGAASETDPKAGPQIPRGGRRVAKEVIAVEGIEVRPAVPEDEPRIAELLELNGVPRPPAEEGFLLAAERDGEVLAALGYRVADGRLLLGDLSSDPRVEERPLARLLYAEACVLARSVGLGEVRARPVRGDHPYELGYRRWPGGWRLDANRSLRLREQLPEGGWRRALALWGFAGVPFFRAFSGPTGDDPTAPLLCAGERNGTCPPSGVPGTEGPDGG